MKHLPHIVSLLMMLFSSIVTFAQTPFDAFSPETSRPILDGDSIAAWRAEQHPDTVFCAIVADLRNEQLLLVDITTSSVLAYAPFTDEIKNWLSVDPLADKYIQNSPYLYCSGNPIMLIDPDGRYSVNKIPEGTREPDQATRTDAQAWLNSHDPTGKSTTFFVTFHFSSNASAESITSMANSFNLEMADWLTKYEKGDLLGPENGIKHVVLQACYGDKVAYEVAKKNPGVYVSGSTGKLASARTSKGWRNVSNTRLEKERFLYFWEREVEVEGHWNTYYCDPATNEVKLVLEWKKPEPPVLVPSNKD